MFMHVNAKYMTHDGDGMNNLGWKTLAEARRKRLLIFPSDVTRPLCLSGPKLKIKGWIMLRLAFRRFLNASRGLRNFPASQPQRANFEENN